MSRRRSGRATLSSWSSSAAPASRPSSGDLSGARYTLPNIIDPDTGEILRFSRRPMRGATSYPQKPFAYAQRYSPFLPSRFSGHLGSTQKARSTKLSQLSIRVPNRVQFCLRRKARRQVLFALSRAGYGGSAPKRKYFRTQNSQYRC